MAKGTYKSFFKDPVVPKSSGASDLELEGSAKLAGGDFEINGQRPVILIGDGELNGYLKELE
jgi:hypothetical protein